MELGFYMGKGELHTKRFYLSQRLIVIVSIFILIASILVVLINFSINMIAASRDYTALLSAWSQLHYKSEIEIEKYARTKSSTAFQDYLQTRDEMNRLRKPIDELFEDEMKPELIFESLRSNHLQLGEISTLIFAFNWFDDLEILQKIHRQWQQLHGIQADQTELLEKLRQELHDGDLDQNLINQFLSEASLLNSQWNTHQNILMAKVETASIVIKRTGLWISVMLGILLVLIGVVISVRAGKSIGRWEQSLHEKEILLSEIHHRVKNNLAVISGLLELESMQSRNPEQALKESRDRIHSMAMIHEILYQSQSFSEIRLDHYIKKLSNYICDTYVNSDLEVDLTMDLQQVTLNINQAVPTGLILNELMANAIEHGFKEQSKGSITIHLQESDRTVSLLLRDNGKGLPFKFDLETADSTGFTIVKALVKQLDGQLSIKNSDVPTLELKFRKSEASGSSNRYF